MQKIRACFIVEEVTRTRFNGDEVTLHAISENESDRIPDAEKFHRGTPSGTFDMQVNNPALAGVFVPGDIYEILLTRVGEED